MNLAEDDAANARTDAPTDGNNQDIDQQMAFLPIQAGVGNLGKVMTLFTQDHLHRWDKFS